MLKDANGCPFPGTHHSNERDYRRSTEVGVGVVPVRPVRILSGLDHEFDANYKVSIYAVVITEGEKASCFF